MSSSGFQITAGVECFIDIYTVEHGQLTFTGGKVLSVKTSKKMSADVGTFDITLAPETISQNLSWSQIITPMSFVVIGMRRADKTAIVMLGFVTSANEKQQWDPYSPVTRTVTISGVDIAYYFTMVDFYSLWYIAATGGRSGIGGQAGLAAGLLSGDPGHIAKTWFTQIMSQGVFANTSIPYKSNSGVSFSTFFGVEFDNYDALVPYSDYFLGTNGAWFDKFRAILPFPFYEFFVTTSFGNAFPEASGGTQIQSEGLGSSVTATAAVIGRINPLPRLVGQSNGNGPPTFTSIDTSLWQKLETFDLQGVGFIHSDINFNESQVSNFYVLNPIWMTPQNGQSNSDIRQFLFNYAVCLDKASISRYGYRPVASDTLWMADPTGSVAQTGQADLNTLMAILLARFCSYYEAAPLMASGTVATWLRPDIEIGTRFEYAPFRDGKTWQFYISGVEQDYVFGGPSYTYITLERGLPKDIYSNTSSNGILFNIHIGNAQRIDGNYQIGLPPGAGQPLQALTPAQFADWMKSIDNKYLSQQATGSPPSQ